MPFKVGNEWYAHLSVPANSDPEKSHGKDGCDDTNRHGDIRGAFVDLIPSQPALAAQDSFTESMKDNEGQKESHTSHYDGKRGATCQKAASTGLR